MVTPDTSPTILVVDDLLVNRELLEAILDEAGYTVTMAQNGEQALASVERDPPSAILLDIMMPGLDGFEVCRRLKSSRRTCFIPVVMITALTSTLTKVQGLEAGADDFLNKPFERTDLLARLRSLLRIRELRNELDSVEELIYAMVEALESKLPGTQGHSTKVAALSRRVGEKLNLTPRELYDLVHGALLHDVGKLAVPEAVLTTEESHRTREQQMLYAAHPVQGDRILTGLESLREARRIVREHHERLDGSGFPDGLSGPAFSLPVEIVAAADLFVHLGAEAESTLREEAQAGRFHPDVIEEILAHGRDLPAEPPSLLDLLPVPPPATGGTVILADPDAERRSVLENILADAGFRTHAIAHYHAALDVYLHRSVNLILADHDFQGFEQLERDFRGHNRPAVILLTSGVPDERLEDPKSSIDEVLRHPVDRQELLARVRSLLRLHSYRTDLLATENVIFALCSALEAKDPFTQGHSVRVGELANRLGQELGLPESDCDLLRTAGLVHDIGKVTVPDEMILAARPYTLAERERVSQHVEKGYELCSLLRSLTPVLPVVRHHLERFDGSGFPDGLTGTAIPFGARVIGLVDAFDALTSARSYRHERSLTEAAFMLVKEKKEGRWDPEVFAAFGRLMQHGGADDLYTARR